MSDSGTGSWWGTPSQRDQRDGREPDRVGDVIEHGSPTAACPRCGAPARSEWAHCPKCGLLLLSESSPLEATSEHRNSAYSPCVHCFTKSPVEDFHCPTCKRPKNSPIAASSIRISHRGSKQAVVAVIVAILALLGLALIGATTDRPGPDRHDPVIAQINATTNCSALQSLFDAAGDSHDVESAGLRRLPRMKLFTSYMGAAHDRMRSIGCYR